MKKSDFKSEVNVALTTDTLDIFVEKIINQTSNTYKDIDFIIATLNEYSSWVEQIIENDSKTMGYALKRLEAIKHLSMTSNYKNTNDFLKYSLRFNHYQKSVQKLKVCLVAFRRKILEMGNNKEVNKALKTTNIEDIVNEVIGIKATMCNLHEQLKTTRIENIENELIDVKTTMCNLQEQEFITKKVFSRNQAIKYLGVTESAFKNLVSTSREINPINRTKKPFTFLKDELDKYLNHSY